MSINIQRNPPLLQNKDANQQRIFMFFPANSFHIYIKGKGKFHPRTGLEDPEEE